MGGLITYVCTASHSFTGPQQVSVAILRLRAMSMDDISGLNRIKIVSAMYLCSIRAIRVRIATAVRRSKTGSCTCHVVALDSAVATL